jgi:hypothetical protein
MIKLISTFFKKYRTEIIILLAIGVLYFISRLILITKPLVYTDEAEYIHFAQVALSTPYSLLVSQQDGRQPLFIWAISFFLLFIKDPLLAGRLVSVFSGFITMTGLGVLSYLLFKKKNLSSLAMILYLFYPFAIVYDRMALLDSMVSAIIIWILITSILLVKYLRIDIAYTLGLLAGAAVITKSNALLGFYLIPVSLIFFDFKKNKKLLRLAKWIFCLFIVYFISQIFNLIIILDPNYQIVLSANSLFIYPLKIFIHLPINFIIKNFINNEITLFNYVIEYLKLPYIFLVLVSLLFIKKYWREKIFLFLYFILPISIYAIFGKTQHLLPRHILYASLPLLILSAWALNNILEFTKTYFKKNKLKYYLSMITILIVFLGYSGYACLTFIFTPQTSLIAAWDKVAYTDQGIAWGFNDSITFFKNQAKNQKIFIAANGWQGVMPDALEMYLIGDKNIQIQRYKNSNFVYEDVYSHQKTAKTYFVSFGNKNENFPEKYNLRLISSTKIGSTNTYYNVYRVMGQKLSD